MRKIIHHRDSGLQRPATRPLPGFLLALRSGAGLTQRDLGAKLHRAAKFVYDCEAGLRRVEVGEFIEWCLACGENPLAALAAYGQLLGGDWAKARVAPYPAGPLPHFSLNDGDTPSKTVAAKPATPKSGVKRRRKA